MKRKSLPILANAHLSDQQPGQRRNEWTRTHELPSVLTAKVSAALYDCDCACGWSAPLAPATGGAHFRYVRSPGTVAIPLEGGWEATYNPAGPTGIAVLNRPSQAILAVFENPATPEHGANRVASMPPVVAREAIDSLARAGLLRPVDSNTEAAPQPSTLSAWLHVTQACNLQCAYCYVHKRPAAMSAEVGTAAVGRLVEVAKRHGYKTLKLKYAGGEPTLNFPVIEAIHDQAVQQVAAAGLTLEEVVLTNGVGVSDTMLDFIVQAGMRLMVSLDGTAETHDRVRVRRDGKSAYAAAIDTVERARARGLCPHISITITSLNLDGISEAVAFALERDLPFNLNFYRECSTKAQSDPHSSTGAVSSLVPDPMRLTSTLLEVFYLIATHPNYPWPLSGILDRTRLDVPHSYPCSAGRDYLAIDTNGRVAACQMLLEEPWSDLGQEDLWSAVRERGRGIFHPVEERSTCQSCMWRTACSGGCPLAQGTVLHDWYCQVYQTLLPELIRLEGLRLLRA